jgi:hypothetical protein
MAHQILINIDDINFLGRNLQRKTQCLLLLLITDVDNKCPLHTSAVISVRSNVCVRPEDGYNMSRNLSPM